MTPRRLPVFRLLMLALALVTLLGLSAAQATGAKIRTHGDSCTLGASSTHATVLDGRVVQAAPTTTNCISR